MIELPIFNSDIIVIAGVIHIKWYGFMYVLGFATAWLIAKSRLENSGFDQETLLDFFTCFALGIICGGRIGYMLIYDFAGFLANPLTLFALWLGGMAFHGALVGGGLATVLFAFRRNLSVTCLIDFTVPLLPPGLLLGRLGNFINGELWGRVTNVSWAMIFPYSDRLPRHPSQLYEMVGEGLILYCLLDLHRRKNDYGSGLMGAWFLLHYGWIRFFLEFFREPDSHLGLVFGDVLSMGQGLCLLMFIAGLFWIAGHRYFMSSGSTSVMV